MRKGIVWKWGRNKLEYRILKGIVWDWGEINRNVECGKL